MLRPTKHSLVPPSLTNTSEALGWLPLGNQARLSSLRLLENDFLKPFLLSLHHQPPVHAPVQHPLPDLRITFILCASAQRDPLLLRGLCGNENQTPLWADKGQTRATGGVRLQCRPLSHELATPMQGAELPHHCSCSFRFLPFPLPCLPPAAMLAAADTYWGLARSQTRCAPFFPSHVSSDPRKPPKRSVWTCALFFSPAPLLHFLASWYCPPFPLRSPSPMLHGSGGLPW